MIFAFGTASLLWAVLRPRPLESLSKQVLQKIKSDSWKKIYEFI